MIIHEILVGSGEIISDYKDTSLCIYHTLNALWGYIMFSFKLAIPCKVINTGNESLVGEDVVLMLDVQKSTGTVLLSNRDTFEVKLEGVSILIKSGLILKTEYNFYEVQMQEGWFDTFTKVLLNTKS